MTTFRVFAVLALLASSGCIETPPGATTADMGIDSGGEMCSNCPDQSNAPDQDVIVPDMRIPDMGPPLEAARVSGPATQDVGRTVRFEATFDQRPLTGTWSVTEPDVLVIDPVAGEGQVTGRGTTRVQFVEDGTGRVGEMEFEGVFDVVEMSNGRRHQCLRTSHGFVHCWGEGDQGQLGNGTQPSDVTFVPQSTGDLRFETLASYEHVTCGVAGTNVVRCWGDGTSGANGSSENDQAVPTIISDGTPVLRVAVGDGFGCILFTNGSVKCWGENDLGQLGPNGANVGAFTTSQIAVPLPDTAIDVDAGEHHACALTANGAAYCWGDNQKSQIDGTVTQFHATPVMVAAGPFVAIDAGDEHTCALDADGIATCWGQTKRVGIGVDSDARQDPIPLQTQWKFRKLVLADDHACGWVDTNAQIIACWGGGSANELGTGNYGSLLPETVEFRNGKTIVDFSTHRFATCVVFDDGSVECVGEPTYGVFGENLEAVDEVPTWTEVKIGQRG